ncbi:hypothetical protein ACHAWO_006264 [Cyclotella atomus]|uniref:EF-hand domain-containing protein n=1 Tax=Cyclotella atomus TaxID=382360 RepID=A0ABD3PV60_9STRA
MINRKTLLASMALASTASAFTYPSQPLAPRTTTALRSSTEDIELTRQVIMDHADKHADNSWIDDSSDENDEQPKKKLIMDIPPSPSSANTNNKAYTKVTTKTLPKKSNPAHKEGLLSPLVYAANSILGKEELNKLRGQIIAYHSDIIKSFVDTSDSAFGKSVLKQLFTIIDVDNSGYLDKEEVGRALNLLGFKWLEEKHVGKIFERADLNEDGEISLEEFIEEAPKTLKVNLVKLAKSNGGELGLLV